MAYSFASTWGSENARAKDGEEGTEKKGIVVGEKEGNGRLIWRFWKGFRKNHFKNENLLYGLLYSFFA